MRRNRLFYLYVLRCRDGSFYTGMTDDISARLEEHRRGVGNDYTRRRLPVFLVYHEPHASKRIARARERQVKGWSRRKKLLPIRGLLPPPISTDSR